MAVSKKKKVAPKAKSAKAKSAKAKTIAKKAPKAKLKAKPKAASQPKTKAKSTPKPKLKAQTSAPQAKAKKPSPVSKAKNSSVSAQKQNFSNVFTPLDDRILVDVLPPETKTAGGLFIPDMAQNRQNRGVVVAVGPGRRNKKAVLRPMDVQMGDQIIYAEYAGTAIEVLGQEVLILREDEVIAIVNK